MRKLRLKKEPFYKEQDEEEHKAFDEEMSEIPVGTTIVSIDESDVQTEMKRTQGRAKRGVKLYVETTGKRTKKLNVVAGYLDGEVIGQTTYAWNTDTEWFCMWFEFVLIPLLASASIIVMDNAGFHNKAYLSMIAEAY